MYLHICHYKQLPSTQPPIPEVQEIFQATLTIFFKCKKKWGILETTLSGSRVSRGMPIRQASYVACFTYLFCVSLLSYSRISFELINKQSFEFSCKLNFSHQKTGYDFFWTFSVVVFFEKIMEFWKPHCQGAALAEECSYVRQVMWVFLECFAQEC